MSVERETWDGPILFTCDQCGEVEQTWCSNFGGALAKIRAHGWHVVCDGDGFGHLCRDCAP